ncbi:hypothetical protein [Paenibacillus sp. B1-33]|uniref:hypothetical protein n=1 Tax=unclassified Paenibacillus TaxID=185978 RepID=UPI003D2B49BD
MKDLHRYRTMVSVLFATIMLPLGLGLLYSMGAQKPDPHKDVAVFTPSPGIIKLSSEQVVDYLSELPLQLKFSRVSWHSGKLAVDVKVAATIVHPEIIYNDMYELLRFAFMQTSNVDRLQLRVVIQDDMAKKKYVLLGMDALRAQVDAESLKLLQKSKEIMPKQLKDAWRVIHTPHWERQFPDAGMEEEVKS